MDLEDQGVLRRLVVLDNLSDLEGLQDLEDLVDLVNPDTVVDTLEEEEEDLLVDAEAYRVVTK